MSVQTPLAPPEPALAKPELLTPTGRLIVWVSGIVSFSLLLYLVLAIAHQVLVAPPTPQLLRIVEDVPLPGGLAPAQTSDLKPGVELQFDGFDFQVYDAPTHRLFIAHTGPSPDLMTLNRIPFDHLSDGHIVVFDTAQNKVVARIPAPQVAGMAEAPDLHKLFAADAEDNIIFDINIDTMKIEGQIQLPDNESPDAIAYDPIDHRMFVSDVGAPVDPLKSANANPKNMNVAVIDALHDKLLTLVPFGFLPLFGGEQDADVKAPRTIPPFGHDVGHGAYDLGHIYVTSQVLPDGDNPNPYILPPPHTGELEAIDAATMRIDKRVVLPTYCSTPHGLAIDTDQHVAFIACTDFDPQAGLFANLLRVSLPAMTVIPADPGTMRLASGPDLVRIDHSAHLLFVACSEGIVIFNEAAGQFSRLGEAVVGRGTHSIAINEQTQEMYFPIFAGGRPLVRITAYNPNGRKA
jgi:DNA-binding beta-propeller fold protein YncE